MTSDPDPAPARMVGDYTLLAKIGEGGMGVVHLARRPGGDRVALKVLRPHIVGDDEARRRLAREVSSLQRIRSRWIAEIVDADPWGPVPYVATRYVPGLSLHDHVHQEGPIEGRDLTWFAGCLAEGLASVHAVGVLHRDVKPSNVLMEGRTPILIDFGLARVADDPRLTHTGWLLGTPGYLAPEILYGEDATPASDVHSWAATVAFAAIGEAPFGRGPSMAIMDRVRRGEFDLGDWTGPLADVVAAALDPAPTERPTLQEILAWLRPQTTQPGPLLGAPPSGPFGPVGPTPDLFDDALAVAALAHGDPPLVPPVPPAPTLVEGPASTRVLPDEVTRRDPAPYAPTQRQPGPPPVYRAQPSVAPPVWWDDAPPGFVFPEAEPRAPWPERLRRGAVVLAGSLAVGAACALAPWVALAVVVTLTWLLRSGSLAASGVADRRELRGRRWYDGLQLLVHAPWLLVASVPGTGMLVLWSAGLAAAAGLLCYAVTAPLEVSLLLSGVVLALATWWGPGSDRLRSPLNRLVVPAARRVGPAWLVTVGALLLFAASVWLYVSAQGISWMPGSSRPFG